MVSILESSQRPNKHAEVKEFLDQVENFNSMLNFHHHHEDNSLFPLLSRSRPIPGFKTVDVPHTNTLDFTRFNNDHIELHSLLEELEAWTAEARKALHTYDPETVCDIMRRIQTLVLPHLKGEEKLVSPNNLKRHFSDRELVGIMKEFQRVRLLKMSGLRYGH
ncbi:hypothetical protein BJ742DRAFT_831248 [Cladochytrium replicatum]|nr:hypothetical protein BJ742DRAFT_831248 [Cladochytrium replicatum]